MKFPRLLCGLAVACLSTNFSAHAELKLPALFADHMVLQQQKPVPVWGWAEAGTKVTVCFAGQTKTTRADTDGKWLVKLDKLSATFTPQTLTITAGETRTLTDVLVGEVWLGSGQSNMEKPIGNQPGQRPTFNAAEELAAANYPNIRLFKVEKNLSATPLADVAKFQGWRTCSSNALNELSFSAAAYFFGQELHTNLNVPVGLIESSWGGTRIEPWTPPAGFTTQPELSTNKLTNTRPTAIYNAMIAPLTGYALRGALWYQGESNLMGTNVDNDYRTYGDKMAALVGGWRKLWGQGNFAFYFVQIAPFKYYSGKTRRVNSPEMLPEFWEIQNRAAHQIKNSGMVLTTDLVDDLNDIHPRNKKDVGLRLARLALEETYDREVISAGPEFRSVRFKNGKAVVRFHHVDGGLVSRDGQPLSWFTVAGADGKFVPAQAQIVGDTVEVSASEVARPRAVRFAWHELAQPNLANGAGLPAVPFRTGL